MIKSLLNKEFVKLRMFLVFVFVALFVLFIYFSYNLNFSFSIIEPENMMWYRFTFLDFKPYEIFKWFLFAFSILLAFVQFLPERLKNRLRIILHLPMGLLSSLSLHIGVGVGVLFMLCIFLGLACHWLLGFYYPYPITEIFLKDLMYYFLGSLMLYLGVSSVILDKNTKVGMLKLGFTLIAFFINLNQGLSLFLWIVFILFLFCYDSFLSAKEQRLRFFIISPFLVLGFLLLCFYGGDIYKRSFFHKVEKFYLFYSPIKKDFVYQKNFGEHQFEYGAIGKEKFSRKTYESYLPFVYWADLDIQKKLPLKLGNSVFTKEQIKKSRLSLSYKTKYLQNGDYILYPLLNSKKNQGIIVFPENMLYSDKWGFKIFHSDTSLEETLTKEANQKAKKSNIVFPIKNVWGKFTNMKVYDLGYMLQDSRGDIYNFRRGDNKITIKKLHAPKDIKYISINENKQKKIAGFAIDKNSKVYIIKWNLEFLPIKLPEFDYAKMDLQILSNPLYYQLRYNDGEKYYISIYDKNFKFLKHSFVEN